MHWRQLQKNDGSLDFVSEEIKREKDVALVVMTENGWAIQYVPEEIQRNRNVILAAAKKEGLFSICRQCS